MRSRGRPVALAVALAAFAGDAAAQVTLADGFYHATLSDTPKPGAVSASQGSGTVYAKAGAAVKPTRAVVYSRDNGNTRYSVQLGYARTPTCGEGLLAVGNTALATSGGGSDSSACYLSFELTPALAASAAKLLGVPRQDRRPAGQAVVGTFAPAQKVFALGQAPEIVLTLSNPAGAPRTQRHFGGRNRGPRDNQFSFEISRDGKPLAKKDGHDFGGLSSFAPLEPGGRFELRAPLAAWGDVGVPGKYEVHCRYETKFSPDGSKPFEDAGRAAIWDRAFEGTVTFDVK